MAIGGLGVFVHMAVLTVLLKTAGASFVLAQSSATLVAMTFNFFLNNTLTYRDKLEGLLADSWRLVQLLSGVSWRSL